MFCRWKSSVAEPVAEQQMAHRNRYTTRRTISWPVIEPPHCQQNIQSKFDVIATEMRSWADERLENEMINVSSDIIVWSLVTTIVNGLSSTTISIEMMISDDN